MFDSTKIVEWKLVFVLLRSLKGYRKIIFFSLFRYYLEFFFWGGGLFRSFMRRMCNVGGPVNSCISKWEGKIDSLFGKRNLEKIIISTFFFEHFDCLGRD